MDAMGNADELAEDDYVPDDSPPLVTSEALALAGLVLALTAPLSANLFQFLGFVLSNQFDNMQRATWQFFFYAAPAALMAGLGAALGLRASRDHDLTGWGRSVAGAAVVVGVVITTVVVAGIVVGFTFGEDPT